MLKRSIEERGFACRVLAKELYPYGVNVSQGGKPLIRIASGNGFFGMDILDVRDELQNLGTELRLRYENIQRALLILEDMAEEAAEQ